ncbi:MAG: hypothetical protein ACLFVU_02430 [Phycisphaerae bacterium]
MIRFSCRCGQKLKVADEHAGKKIRCPKCKNISAVPPAPQSDAVADSPAPSEPQVQDNPKMPASKHPPKAETGGDPGSALSGLASAATSSPQPASGTPTTQQARNAPAQPQPTNSAGPARKKRSALRFLPWVFAGLIAVAVVGVLLVTQPWASSEETGSESGGFFSKVSSVLGGGSDDGKGNASAGSKPVAIGDVTAKPTVQAIVFGGSEDDQITHMDRTADGSLVVCGILGSADATPRGVQPNRLLTGSHDSGTDFGFVGKLSDDLQKWDWFSVFPAEAIRPSRVLVCSDGDVVVGGSKLGNLPQIATNVADWGKSDGALLRLRSDGKKVEWINRAGPNQTHITGLAEDKTGRIYWTAGTRGKGMAAYLLRVNADGSESEWSYDKSAGWSVSLHHNDGQLLQEGEYYWYYRRGWDEDDKDGYFDYDGEGGWAPVKFWVHGVRQGGQVLVLPDGDIVVTGSMFYGFQVKGKKGYPAFDLFMARYDQTGKLKWSTNCYREGDSIHTPDQKPNALAYDPATDTLYVCAWQHGSNQYRFKGKLVGDTGNLSINWVGKVAAKTGRLDTGWYWQNSYKGDYGENGIPQGWPKLAGNNVGELAVDASSRVHIAGKTGARMWTTDNAYQPWPEFNGGGGFAAAVVLGPKLNDVKYAGTYRGTEENDDRAIIGSGMFNGLELSRGAVYHAGWTSSPGTPNGTQPSWANKRLAGKKDCLIVKTSFPE